MSPSNFNAVDVHVNGWRLDSDGRLQNHWYIGSFGARQIPATIKDSLMSLKIKG